MFFFCSHLHLLFASCHLCLRLHLLLTTCWYGVRFCISPSLQPHHIYMVLDFTSHVHHFCFCIANVFAFLLLILHHFVFLCKFVMLLKLCGCFINFCVQFVHVSKFLGFFYLMCYVGAICLNFNLYFLFLWVFFFKISFCLFLFFSQCLLLWKWFLVKVLQILLLKFWRIPCNKYSSRSTIKPKGF